MSSLNWASTLSVNTTTFTPTAVSAFENVIKITGTYTSAVEGQSMECSVTASGSYQNAGVSTTSFEAQSQNGMAAIDTSEYT